MGNDGGSLSLQMRMLKSKESKSMIKHTSFGDAHLQFSHLYNGDIS